MRELASLSAAVFSAFLLAGCGARSVLDVSSDGTSFSGSTATSGGLGGAGAGTTTGTGTGAGGAGGGLFELAKLDKPVELALDAEYVYVSVRGSSEGAGQVVKLPKGGGAPIAIASGLTKTGHMVADATTVFFIHHPDDKYKLVSVSKAGGNQKGLASWKDTCWLAVDAERLYCGHPTPYMYSPGILAISKQSGGVTTLGDYQNFVFSPGYPRGIVVDDESIYWMADLTLYAMSKLDEIVVALSLPFGTSTRLAQDAARLYWTTSGSLSIAVGSMSKDGGEITWLGEDTKAGTRSLAVDDTYVYWANDVEGTIKRVAKGGGPTTVIASEQGLPQAMAADDSGVYWLNNDDGRVMRFVD